MNKLLKKIVKLSVYDLLLFTEACFYAVLGRFFIFVLPTHIWIKFIGVPTKNLSDIASVNEDFDISYIFRAMRRSTVYLPFKQKCLIEALVVKKMLARRGVKTIMTLGVARDEERALIAHAWLIFNGKIVVGGRGSEKFAVLQNIA